MGGGRELRVYGRRGGGLRVGRKSARAHTHTHTLSQIKQTHARTHARTHHHLCTLHRSKWSVRSVCVCVVETKPPHKTHARKHGTQTHARAHARSRVRATVGSNKHTHGRTPARARPHPRAPAPAPAPARTHTHPRPRTHARGSSHSGVLHMGVLRARQRACARRKPRNRARAHACMNARLQEGRCMSC